MVLKFYILMTYKLFFLQHCNHLLNVRVILFQIYTQKQKISALTRATKNSIAINSVKNRPNYFCCLDIIFSPSFSFPLQLHHIDTQILYVCAPCRKPYYQGFSSLNLSCLKSLLRLNNLVYITQPLS